MDLGKLDKTIKELDKSSQQLKGFSEIFEATHVKLENVDIQAIALLFTALHLGYVVTEVQCSYRIFGIVQLYVGSRRF